MKTSKKLSFPKLENEFLENILRQLVNQHSIIQMFFTRQPSFVFSYLIIHIEKNIDAQELQQNKWVEKVKKRYQIYVYFIYSERLHHRFSLGHPFIEFYCQPSAIIYQNKELENPLIIKRDWKKYKKRFNMFEDHFHHDYDLHLSHVQNLISEGSSNSVFTSYSRLIEYDLEYLEELYSGNRSASLNLDERITNLIEYIPDIQKYFVRNSHSKYYLIDLFVKAKEASINDDEAIYKNEMYEAVGIAEQSLYCLIEERFDQLKKLIKKGLFERHDVVSQIDDKPNDIILSVAIETILNSVEVEQIYLYHQITDHEKTTYYLMLIAMGAGNEKLKLITQFLKSKTGKKYDFVLLSHSRYWIQTNLYQHQSFFSKIIQGKYLTYSSNEYLPEFHWEVPHNPYHADLHFYYKPTKDIALQFFTIVNDTKENYQGLDSLFTLFFMSFCRTYIFIKTYYLPNYLSNQTLWQLCIYADADMKKYNYIIEQFWTDFFPYLDRHMILHHKLSKLNKEEVNQMNVVVEKLMSELHNLVIEDGLLLPFKQD
ncbi:hypothetical protein [Flavobacterium xinjiangense]|uniref:Uncharacterized protein n=1 Tax=Flavobacterium xinjiangense TaxID=178356 RepID=A0A1M7DI72_9FLAO|nr:hypothetical protein [Flavobacterium xinjiangense]SHL79221.1 hypothetical protein SAMN05216269_101128 [Flavobacterium xinjiangense]